jgi:hypothetical protein
MTTPRIIRRGPMSLRVWPLLAAAALLAAAVVLVPGPGFRIGESLPLLVAALASAGWGILNLRLPLVVLEEDRFSVRGERRPDGLAPQYEIAGCHGTAGGMRPFQSIEGSYESVAPSDLPWDAAVPRDLVTGAAVRNGRLVVTLRDRKGRSIPVQGISPGDRDALLDWFGVEAGGERGHG